MIRFILNDTEQQTDMPAGMPLLDYIRYRQHLTGTKIGCREGDCGACTVLLGSLRGGVVEYLSVTSCLTPLGSVQGKQVVTIEGVNMPGGNLPQRAMADCSATQCGFCTPGFVVSLAGFCLSKKTPDYQHAISSIDGNICRCTGYKSIERAAAQIAAAMNARQQQDPVAFVVSNHFLPEYLTGIAAKLSGLALQLNGFNNTNSKDPVYVGGGTDLYVQKHEDMKYAGIAFMDAPAADHSIRQEGKRCIFGQAVTVSDLAASPLIQQYFPSFSQWVRLVSSTPIRNMATIAGNFINASPIGDFTIFFLALNAVVVLDNGICSRSVPLDKLYKQYKELDKTAHEYIREISFELPAAETKVHFEKVSKRTHLDIASVNSAICISVENDSITAVRITAGGVGPIPKLLRHTNQLLLGKRISPELVVEAIAVAQTEISPISDARGTVAYKRLLLAQLIKAHFITLFPLIEAEKLISA